METHTDKAGQLERMQRAVRLQLGDSGMKWPRYDTSISPDSRSMNLKETCLDDVKNMMICGQKKIFERLGREA